MRQIEAAAALGLACAVLLGGTQETAATLAAMRDDVLRLHILASSDSDTDQARKHAVRDVLLARSEDWFGACESAEDAAAAAVSHREDICRTARGVLHALGWEETVSAEVVDMPFDTRVYDTFTMPAGRYTALRIVIGEGRGHNWWCVMYPPLCLPGAADTSAYFDAETTDLLTSPADYEVRFKCAEWYEAIRDRLSET